MLYTSLLFNRSNIEDMTQEFFFSDEQVAITEMDGGWARVRSSSNTLSADCDFTDTEFSSRVFQKQQYNRQRRKVSIFRLSLDSRYISRDSSVKITVGPLSC